MVDKSLPSDINNHDDENNSHHQPILILSSSPQPVDLEVPDTRPPMDESLSLFPKKPNSSPRSLTQPSIPQVSDCASMEKGTEFIGIKSDLVQVSDEPQNLDDNGNSQRNEAIKAESSVSGKISVNQSVPCGMPKKGRNASKKRVGSKFKENNERLCGFLLHKLMKSRFEGLNGDSELPLTNSVKVEVIDETALIDVSGTGGKVEKKRGGKVESNGRRKRIAYSRKEMEELRFINVKGQKKFWQEIYYSFGELLKREYDQMGNFRRHLKPGERHQDPGTSKNYGRGILGVAAENGTWNHPNLYVY